MGLFGSTGGGIFGLGGLGGSTTGAIPPQGLLGQYYDPAEMRRQQLKQGLLGAGIALLQGGQGSTGAVIGQGLAGGLGMANQAGQDYRQGAFAQKIMADRQAEDAFQRQRQVKQDAWTAQEHQQQLDAAEQAKQQQMAQAQALASWASTKPPDFQAWAKQFPGEAIKVYSNEMTPQKPADPVKMGLGDSLVDPRTGRTIVAMPPKTDSNGITFTDANGNVTQIGGSGKAATQVQGQNESYYLRAKPTLAALDNPKYSAALTSGTQTAAGSVPVIGNALVNKDTQVAKQAAENFLTAILRKESGAAINKDEYDRYGAVFLPVFGDQPDVLAQKSIARKNAIEGMKRGMSPDAILLDAMQNKSAPATSDTGVEEYDANGNRIN
jgi:hypothetical protein